jgi:hypothetical protein
VTTIKREFVYLIARAKRDGDGKLERLLREDAFLKDVELPDEIEALPSIRKLHRVA